MLRWASPDDAARDRMRSAVTIGVFDGVHRGHRAVVGRTVEAARAAGLRAVVVTFDPHPLAVLRPDAAPAAISTLDHRLDLLAALGVDATLVLPFTREVAAWSPEEFVRRVLVDALDTAHVIVGEDFRFGARAAGDVALLRQLGGRLGFTVDAVAAVGETSEAHETHRWSSTLVRARLAAGDVETAAEMLGHRHRVEGVVVRGDQRGRALGYPTANLRTAPDAAVPADGIYAGTLHHAGRAMPAAISIGTNPTFDGVERRVEAYALDRDDLELYGEHVAVDFTARLRDTLRFESVDALLEQMARDVGRARDVERARALGDGGAPLASLHGRPRPSPVPP